MLHSPEDRKKESGENKNYKQKLCKEGTLLQQSADVCENSLG